MGHLELNRETESSQYQVWWLVSVREDEMDLSPWREREGHEETVDKPGEGHRSSRQHLRPRNFRMRRIEAL